ncbi:PHB depolymerase family esterase [Streptomyces sp. NPDC048045]|uniref:PHB depolymerase family esterase n=1 Tax=Streptomyces sp. NPDC048045 TaxID=3154710 RepID=UPI00341ED388
MLTAWLGGVAPRNTGAPKGTLTYFDQNAYAPGGSARALSMDSTGQLYVPPACADGAPCKLVVALHGCLSAQQLLGTAFAEKGNLDTYADTNHLVVLYPQAVSGVWPVNPQGRWDWFGYTGCDYAVRTADDRDRDHGPRPGRLIALNAARGPASRSAGRHGAPAVTRCRPGQRPGSRAVTSCTNQLLPSGSSKERNEL